MPAPIELQLTRFNDGDWLAGHPALGRVATAGSFDILDDNVAARADEEGWSYTYSRPKRL